MKTMCRKVAGVLAVTSALVLGPLAGSAAAAVEIPLVTPMVDFLGGGAFGVLQ